MDDFQPSETPTMTFLRDVRGVNVTTGPVLSPKETMELVQEIYDRVGPELGCRFVEPPILLMLSGRRGVDEWNAPDTNPRPELLEKYRALNKLLAPRGIAVLPDIDYLQSGRFTLVNLGGLERVTKATDHGDLVPPFSCSSGWEGYVDYRHDLSEFDERAAHVQTGVQLGYPDLAIRDACLGPVLFDKDRTVVTRLKFGNYYECSTPDYGLDRDHAQDPSIQAHVKSWDRFLERCYGEPAHAKLQKSEAFQAARLKAVRERSGPTASTPELVRWGKAVKVTTGFDPNKELDHEVVLQRHSDTMIRALEEGESPSTIARRYAGALPMEGYTLVQWTKRGLVEPTGTAGPLARAMVAHQRPLLEGHGRREWHALLTCDPNHANWLAFMRKSLSSPLLDLVSPDNADSQNLERLRSRVLGVPDLRDRLEQLLA